MQTEMEQSACHVRQVFRAVHLLDQKVDGRTQGNRRKRLNVRPREDLHMCIHIHTMRFRRKESH